MAFEDNRPIHQSILYDSSGNAISTELDGSIRRVAVTASLKAGTTVNIGSQLPTDLTLAVREKLTDGGGSDDMLVDGSSVAVEFTYDADPADNITLLELRFVMVANTINVDGSSFGPVSSLTNGLKLEVRSNGSTTQLMLAKITEEFLSLPSPLIFLDRGGTKDTLAFSFSFGGTVSLIGGTGDFVKVTVQDDLTSARFQVLHAAIAATKEA